MADYDKNLPPPTATKKTTVNFEEISTPEPLIVRLGMAPTNIDDVDVNKRTFSGRFMLRLMWMDTRLVWHK